MAVCILPGTEIAFDTEVICDHFLAFIGSWRLHRKCLGKVARFRRINQHRERAHHDALEFSRGQTVLLTRLLEGQNATVLQLPVPRKAVRDVEEEAHWAESLA